MSFDPARVETVTVDSYGTLVDPSAVKESLSAHVEGSTETPEGEMKVTLLSNHWRSRSLMYTMVSNYIDAYQPFYDLNRHALEHALHAYGVDLDTETIEDVLSTYHELAVFEDVKSGLERITDGGYEVYVVSNGNPDMLDSMVEHAAITDVIADTISADEIATFKPDPEIYRHAAARSGTPIAAIAHVAGPSFDVQGAMNAGMQGVWLTRDDEHWDGFAPEPNLVAESFHDVAEALGV